MNKRIVYHGTNKESANKIIEEGFNPGTYFAIDLADALEMGGPYVFRVVFEMPENPLECNWQIRPSEAIAKENIVELTVYSTSETLFKNEDLIRQVFEEALAEERLRT